MHQLPCVLSLVLTGHKTQGLTTDSIILSGLAPKEKSGVSGWLYVILSRVKTIEGLFLMENIEQNPTKYNARNDVQREMNRLRAINLQTIQRLQAAKEEKTNTTPKSTMYHTQKNISLSQRILLSDTLPPPIASYVHFASTTA